jgi:hypothetical protein
MNDTGRQYLIQILKKYREGEATSEEKIFLEAYYNTFDLNEDVITEDNEAKYARLKAAIKNIVDQRIELYQKKQVSGKVRSLWIRYVAAASILIFISFGSYLFIRNHSAKNTSIAHNAYKGIVPGGNKAILKLANGLMIALDDAMKGEIARQAGVTITKTADGQVVYHAAAGDSSQEKSVENAISTPRGGQYKVILPDGTAVWLNAASSITYPTQFKNTERVVSLTGEAYFEVTKNKQAPFKVKSVLQTIEVLGTHFNINAYADEAAVATTLLEGSVKVTSASASALISPGEQALISRVGEGGIAKRQVNTDKEVAWKNGVFSFEGEDVRSIMRQVGRWYDIEVAYAGNIPREKYFGEISRSSSLADVFKILELNNLRFNVEGKTVTVAYKK